MTKGSKGLIGCFLIIMVLFLCCAGTSLLLVVPLYEFYKTDDVYIEPFNPNSAEVIEEYEEPEIVTDGSIEGSLGYPSEFIPHLVVCAERIDGTGEYCTKEIIESDIYTNGQGYKLWVPEGDYYVYSARIDDDGKRIDLYQSYYSDFVKCGMSVECTSHEPIPLRILPGIEVLNADPIDWYAE